MAASISLRSEFLKLQYRLGWKKLPKPEVFQGQPYAVEFRHALANQTHIDYAATLEEAERMARGRYRLASNGQARVHTTKSDGSLGEPVGFYAQVGSYPTWFDARPKPAAVEMDG